MLRQVLLHANILWKVGVIENRRARWEGKWMREGCIWRREWENSFETKEKHRLRLSNEKNRKRQRKDKKARKKNKQGETSVLGSKNATMLCLKVYFLKATPAVASGRWGRGSDSGNKGRTGSRWKVLRLCYTKCGGVVQVPQSTTRAQSTCGNLFLLQLHRGPIPRKPNVQSRWQP